MSLRQCMQSTARSMAVHSSKGSRTIPPGLSPRGARATSLRSRSGCHPQAGTSGCGRRPRLRPTISAAPGCKSVGPSAPLEAGSSHPPHHAALGGSTRASARKATPRCPPRRAIATLIQLRVSRPESDHPGGVPRGTCTCAVVHARFE